MTTPDRPVKSENEIRDWIVDKLVNQAGVDPAEVNLDEPLVALGVDSMQFVVLVGELEEFLECRFAANPLSVYPTVNALSAYLAEQLQAGRTVIDPSQS